MPQNKTSVIAFAILIIAVPALGFAYAGSPRLDSPDGGRDGRLPRQ